MSKEYRGFSPEIVAEYLSGKTIQFREIGRTGWRDIPEYQEPADILRVSNTRFVFRVKEVVKVYTVTFDSGLLDDLDKYPSLWGTKLQFTEVDGKITKVSIL